MKKDSFSGFLEEIAAGPKAAGHSYVLSGYTYEDVYAMACYLQQRHFPADRQETVCLCSRDRAVTAAALLAAITRPVTLVIPYSFTADVLSRTHQACAFSKAISDTAVPVPGGVETVIPEHEHSCGHRLDYAGIRDPDSVFVRLFTGGSTGEPVTWSKTIRNLFGEALYHARKLEITENDLFAATVPAYHIYGLLFSVLTPFVASASVIGGELTYPREIRDAVGKKHATILVSIPLHYRMLAGKDFKAEGLRFALSSAARLEEADSKAFYRQTGLGITEVFGSTETGGIATRLCSEEQPHFTPFDCIDWKITDHLLAIRSDFVSPELPVDTEGFFVTSDLANTVGPSGFQLAGRADSIVKVGGRRVDLGEVKSAIVAMTGVEDAAVICAEDSRSRGNEIRALVAADIGSDEIRRYLKNRVPDYAVPRRIRVVKRIPVSPAGKYESTEIHRLLAT